MENVRTIKILPLEKRVFVKKINLENTRLSGVLCYARKPYDGYSMKPDEMTQIERNMYGYKEHEYPSDDLDVKILDQIHQQFPNATCQTSILMFDVEVERNCQWIEQLKRETFRIVLEYIPVTLPPIGADIYDKEVEIYYYPLPEDRLNRLNTHIFIKAASLNEFQYLKSLLENTVILFSDLCK